MNKFDRILWRINGVILLALVLYALGASIWLSTELRPGPPQHPPHAGAAPTPEAVGGNAPLHLANPNRITGTPFVRASLETESEENSVRPEVGPGACITIFILVHPTFPPGGCLTALTS
jgi:hypothetical protein